MAVEVVFVFVGIDMSTTGDDDICVDSYQKYTKAAEKNGS